MRDTVRVRPQTELSATDDKHLYVMDAGASAIAFQQALGLFGFPAPPPEADRGIWLAQRHQCKRLLLRLCRSPWSTLMPVPTRPGAPPPGRLF